MEQPEGFLDNMYSEFLCILIMVPYKPNQASRQRFENLNEHFVENFGMRSSECEQCFYALCSSTEVVITALYVNIMLIESLWIEWVSEVEEKLSLQFETKDSKKPRLAQE